MPAPDVPVASDPVPGDSGTDDYHQDGAAPEHDLSCGPGLFSQPGTKQHGHDNRQCSERPERRIGQLGFPATLRGDVRQIGGQGDQPDYGRDDPQHAPRPVRSAGKLRHRGPCLRQASHPEGDSEEIRRQMKRLPLNPGPFNRLAHQVPGCALPQC